MSADQPAWLVISPGRTGTSVHWSGRTSSTSADEVGPRVALDVELHAAAQRRQLARDLADVGGGDVPRVGARDGP